MMSKLFFLWFFLISIQALKEGESVETAGGIVELTPQNWNHYVNGNKAVFVKFYAPWCGHCQSLAPHFQRLAEHFRGNDNIIIAEANGDKYREFIRKHNIRGYPTLKFFAKGKATGEEAHCGHYFESMRDYINRQLGSK